jgi:Phage terminase large subunit
MAALQRIKDSALSIDERGNPTKHYHPSTTAAQFHNDNSFCRALMGPVGSGKSVACCMEILQRAMQQKAYKGIRDSRWAVVRKTFSQLEMTTLPTFLMWLGQYGKVNYGSPITFNASIPLPDKTTVRLEVLFFPMDVPDDAFKIKSLELTGIWINEAQGIDTNFLTDIVGRIGRWTGRDGMHPPSWKGIIMDANPPSTKHWFYDLFEKRKPDTYKLYRQPSALLKLDDGSYIPNPMAENVAFLGGFYDYYYNIIRAGDEAKIKTDVMGEYGQTFDGKPVYSKYDDRIHAMTEAYRAPRGSQIVVGMDFGLNPAAVFGQLTSTGALACFDELAPLDIPFEDFLDEHFVPMARTKYAGHKITIIGDPTGDQRASTALLNAYDMLKQRGFEVYPAISNDPALRRAAVSHFLLRRNGFFLTKECEFLRDGFQGAYRFERIRGTADKYKLKAEKNDASHVHDALQYLALYYYRGHGREDNNGTTTNFTSYNGFNSGPPPQKKFLWA